MKPNQASLALFFSLHARVWTFKRQSFAQPNNPTDRLQDTLYANISASCAKVLPKEEAAEISFFWP